MVLRSSPARVASICRLAWPGVPSTRPSLRRHASTDTSEPDLEPSSFVTTPLPPTSLATKYNPVARARKALRLPRSRYQYRSPKYYRGPLHPHQPLPKSDPNSRNFIPGPFSLPRLEQTYQSTVAPDLLTLMYSHRPPDCSPEAPEQRLRTWQGDSPYFQNRPLRPPKGSSGSRLRLMTPPCTFRNVPGITGVTVHSMASQATESSAYLHVAGMVVQAMTNVRVTTHTAKKGVAGWGLRQGHYIAVTAEAEREDAHHFLSKLVDMVLPRIKDWKGVRATSGDGSGNISFGLAPEHVAFFPEIEVNYDMYPPKMIPGCHITIKTSATNDRNARLLLQAIGIPFDGKLRG